MKIIVEIPDSKADFGMKVLKSLSFIKKAKPMSTAAIELHDELTNAKKEVILHKKGEIELKTAQELLNEL